MNKNNLCKYVDPFYGNFEPQLPKPNLTASKWFFLKAQVGNTSPAATSPFGMVSACAYTGGYPTGYGPYLPNSHARPGKLMPPDSMTALGFSHFHQSGTGNIAHFYNFSIITPINGKHHNRFDRFPLTDEKAAPGRYSCKLGNIYCDATVSDSAAVYNFVFDESEENGIVFDPILNGIFLKSDKPQKPLGKIKYLSEKSKKNILSGVLFESGITLHTSVYCPESERIEIFDDSRVKFTVGRHATVYLGFSFASPERASDGMKNAAAAGFDSIADAATELWENALGKIQITASEEYKVKFYSNLYHCFIKPTDISGDIEFCKSPECFADFATLWDMGKTQLPLIFSLFGDISGKIVRSMLNVCRLTGHFQNSVLLMDFINNTGPCDMQARALSVNSIYDAYLRGAGGVDWSSALDCMTAEMNIDANRNFLYGREVSDYASHTIDLAVAAHSISCLAEELGCHDTAERFGALSDNWSIVYDAETGVINDRGRFYEGCNLNYSFRLLPNMEKRIELAGGSAAFEHSLDNFFGFDQPPAIQCLDPGDKKTMREGEARRGFEGFNNETDMETPYCYCYIGRHDKACEIVRTGEKYMFGMSGRGALCGNEDSGGLSSLYIVNALGIFPVSGQDKIILGSPAIESASLALANGKTLKITVDGFDENKFIPKKIFFCDKELKAPFITVKQMMNGGEIRFVMK